MEKTINKQRGAVARLVLVLAAVVLIITVIVFIALKIASSKKTESNPKDQQVENNEPPKPIYEVTIGDIKLTLQSSVNLGSRLKSQNSYQADLVTTERFIKVTIGGQNKGKNEIPQFSWDTGNIIDSEGRNFTPITNRAYYFLPKPDQCGASLKPEFAPISCVRMYEVSRKSKGLKLQVISKVPKTAVELLDLNIVE